MEVIMTKKDDTSTAAAVLLNELDELGSIFPLEQTHVDHFERTAQDVAEYKAMLERLEQLHHGDKNERVSDVICGLKYDLQRVKEV
jgi:hypothetical protein